LLGALVLIVAGICLFTWNQRRQAHAAMRTQLVVLGVSIGKGVTLLDLEQMDKDVHVAFELNRAHLPKGFSLARLDLKLEAAEYWFKSRMEYPHIENEMHSISMNRAMIGAALSANNGGDMALFDKLDRHVDFKLSCSDFLTRSLTRAQEAITDLLSQL
jgi:hypothetical protein